MKYSIQHFNIFLYFIRAIIYGFLLIFLNQNPQYTLANTTTDNHFIKKNSTIDHPKKKQLNIHHDITIQANQAKFNFKDKQAHFSGNVIVTHKDNILHANEIYLYKQVINKGITHTMLSGTGNIRYNNNTIHLIGERIQTNFQTKNTDLYLGNFYFTKYKTYGTAHHIKQRANNRYTILQNANLTTCPPEKKYWKLTGSQVSYDHQKDIFDIWNVRFKIKDTSILYIPYLQLSLGNENNFKYHLPIPEYNENGISIKIPYHFTINKYCYGDISTFFIPRKGVQLQNRIQYSEKLNTGNINFEILNHNQSPNNNIITDWLLYYNLNAIIQQKWKIYSHFIKISDLNYFQNSTLKQTYSTKNHYIKKTFFCQHSNNSWNIDLSYKEFQPLNYYITNIYNTKPQLNFNFHTNKFKPLSFHLFGQLTQFKNINHNYPKTIRTHIEPSITTSSKIFNTNSNTKITLKTTHYLQNNINYYNQNIQTTNNKLKHSVNRYIPQFKNNTIITLQKKTKATNKYKQQLESQIQYLYVPYRKQNNIAIYDTTIFPIDYTNLFEDTLFNGLDRIAPANQLTSSLNAKIYNKNNIELFNTSLGQIYFFTQKNIRINDIIYNYHKKNYNMVWAANNKWIIKKSLKINTNVQYDAKIKEFTLGNAIFEHKNHNNKILQINYRYFNSKYFTKKTPEPINSNYQKNITQIGIIANFPINNYWTIGGTQFYNTKHKQIINQTFGMQFYTCCWKINVGYERKINIWNQKTYFKTKYNNKILLNLTLYQTHQNQTLNPEICDILNAGTLPYQTIL